MDCETRKQWGLTLIEMLVAMTISSVLILGSVQLYTQTQTQFKTAENLARLQENLHFALGILESDIRIAGFWGRTTATTALRGRSNVTVTCAGNTVTEWIIGAGEQPIPAVEALEATDSLPCSRAAPRSNSDTLIVRHTKAAQGVIPQEGSLQIKTNFNGGEFFDDGVAPSTVLNYGKVFDVAFNAWYISDESRYALQTPSLRRLTLIGGRLIDEEILAGVENLQVQFGIDTDGDDSVDRYIDGKSVINPDAIISVRLWLLIRAEHSEGGLGFRDTNTYPASNSGGLTIMPAVHGNYPSDYRRIALSKTILLRNQA